MKLSPTTNPDSTLVATKFSDTHALLLSHAVAQARSGGARILLVHVVPPFTSDKKTAQGVVRIAPAGLSQNARDALEYEALQLQWQGIVCDPVLLNGDPAEQIAAIARARGADRILLGPSRRYASTGEGASVAERLMASIDIPVFVLDRQLTPRDRGFLGGDGREPALCSS